MISMTNLTQPGLLLHWYEAVAIIAELAGTMRAGKLARVPTPSSVVITADGTLLVSGPDTLEGSPPRELAGLLEGLLSQVSCPSELGQFVAQNVAEPPAHATLEDFADALAFFERPGRNELLKAVAGRATQVETEARAKEELERLKARAKDGQDQAGNSHREDARSRPRRRTLLFASVAGALVIVSGAVFVLLATGSKPSAISGRVQARVKQIVQTGLEAVGAAKLEEPPAPVEAPAAVPTTRPKRKPLARRSPPVDLTVRVEDLGGVPTLDLESSDVPDLPDPPVDNTVYGADADGVEPPVLVRPHLPSQPSATTDGEQLGVLELVVSQMGVVEHVRLISPENRYHDRMIVAAAKTWRFRPAVKDGAPVRSLTRIRVTL
jgi:hypothetical protein